MARVVETEEPTVVREERVEHVHDEAPRSSNTGAVIAVIVLIILLILLFVWRPWGGGSTSGGGANINVTAPSGSSGTGQ